MIRSPRRGKVKRAGSAGARFSASTLGQMIVAGEGAVYWTPPRRCLNTLPIARRISYHRISAIVSQSSLTNIRHRCLVFLAVNGHIAEFFL